LLVLEEITYFTDSEFTNNQGPKTDKKAIKEAEKRAGEAKME
jgi:hypothetical protein